jgi:hypothetical protein
MFERLIVRPFTGHFVPTAFSEALPSSAISLDGVAILGHRYGTFLNLLRSTLFAQRRFCAHFLRDSGINILGLGT